MEGDRREQWNVATRAVVRLPEALTAKQLYLLTKEPLLHNVAASAQQDATGSNVIDTGGPESAKGTPQAPHMAVHTDRPTSNMAKDSLPLEAKRVDVSGVLKVPPKI